MAADDAGKPKRSRRGRGEGSIHQRTDGRWVATLDLGIGADGKRRRRYVYGKTKSEVRKKLVKLQGESEAGRVVDPNRVTVGEYVRSWLQGPARSGWRVSTIESYERMVRVHITPRIGHIVLQKLTEADVQHLHRSMADAGLSPRMQQYAHSLLRHALHDAQRSRLVPGNVCDSVDRPQARPPETKFLSVEEMQKLFIESKPDREHNLYIVAGTTGLRQGELLALRWSDIDLEAGVLRVRRKVVEVLNRFDVGPPKTKRGSREVALPPFTVAALRDQAKRLRAEGLTGCELVFPNQSGEFQRRNFIGRQFTKRLEASGLPVVRFHDLRHSHASHLLQQRESPKIVSERLGHASVGITLDIYSHATPNMQTEAAAKIGEMFTPKRKPRKKKPDA